MCVEQIILELIDELQLIDPRVHLNERYLHHKFSFKVQKCMPLTYDSNSRLHPEWATYIKGIDIRNGGLYYKEGNQYKADKLKGSSGFIDFAIGNADNPDYGIEFKMSTQLNKEGLIYDYMKLLDGRNNIEGGISLAVYYGHSSHSSQCEKSVLEECLLEAKARLGESFKARPHWFILLEVIDGAIANRFDCVNNMHFNKIK